MEDRELFGVALEGCRVIWVAERLQNGTWTARYCWHRGTDAQASRALQEDVLNGKSRRLPGAYDSEAATVEAIRQSVQIESRGQGMA
jgi:hypothetical protein